jgi:hypothetical protein
MLLRKQLTINSECAIGVSDDHVTNLSTLDISPHRDIHRGEGHRVIQRMMLNNPATSTPLCDFVGVTLSESTRVHHQISSYSPST